MSDNPIGPLQSTIPLANSPVVNPGTGIMTEVWWYVLQRLLVRTGGSQGISSAAVQAVAQQAEADAQIAITDAAAALTAAEAAQATANTAETDAAAAQTTANTAQTTAVAAGSAASTAQTTANTALATAGAAATAASAAQTTANAAATKANPAFTGAAPEFGTLFGAYASDAAAAIGGIIVGQLYWNTVTAAVAQRRV